MPGCKRSVRVGKVGKGPRRSVRRPCEVNIQRIRMFPAVSVRGSRGPWDSGDPTFESKG